MKRVAALVLVAVLSFSQARAVHSQTADRRLSISLGASAANNSRQAETVETEMRNGGFGATRPASCDFFCEPARAHPYGHSSGHRVSISAEYRASHRFGVKAQFFEASLGGSRGYHQARRTMYIDTELRGLALLVSTPVVGPLRVAAGPTQFKVHVQSASEEYNVTKTGLVIEAAGRFPERSRFFLELTLQQRFVGRAHVGPFTSQYVWPDPMTPPEILLPAFNHSLDHLSWSMGVGFRL